MSILLKKKYPSPAEVGKTTVKAYYDDLGEALKKMHAEPNTDEESGVPFFFVMDFQFKKEGDPKGETAPLLWIGKLSPEWKQYYKQVQKQTDFAAGTAQKVKNPAGNQIPYEFSIEEGKGAKKGFIQQVAKTVKRETSKEILFTVPSNDEDSELTRKLDRVESSSSSLFERLRRVATQYTETDSTKMPLVKIELRQQAEALLEKWEHIPVSERSTEQKEFVEKFVKEFQKSEYLYRDRVAEILGLLKKCELEYKEYQVEKLQAQKDYTAGIQNNDPEAIKAARAELRRDFKEMYLELQDLEDDLDALAKKRDDYFHEDRKKYDGVPSKLHDVQKQAQGRIQQLREVIARQMEELKRDFTQLGGNAGELDLRRISTEGLPIALKLNKPDNLHPTLEQAMDKYEKTLEQFRGNLESGAEELQQKIAKINKLVYTQQQVFLQEESEYYPDMSRLNAAMGKIRNELREKDSQGTLRPEDLRKAQEELAKLEKRRGEIEGKINEVKQKHAQELQDLNKLQEQLFYARKTLTDKGLLDRLFERVLDGYEHFQELQAEYEKLVSGNFELAEEIELRGEVQHAIDLQRAYMDSWQEEHIDLKQLEIKDKNRRIEQIRSELAEFCAKEYAGRLRFDFPQSTVQRPQYVPTKDAYFDDHILPLLKKEKYETEKKETLDELIHKTEKHGGFKDEKEEEKYFKRRHDLCVKRIKELRGIQEHLGKWKLLMRPMEPSEVLEAHQKKVAELEKSIHQEFSVLQTVKELDLIHKNSENQHEKIEKLQKDRDKALQEVSLWASKPTTGLNDEQKEKINQKIQQAWLKFSRIEAQQYRNALSTLEGVSASRLYDERLKGILDEESVNKLMQSQRLRDERSLQDANTFLQDQARVLQQEFEQIQSKIGTDSKEESLEQLRRLELRLAPFFLTDNTDGEGDREEQNKTLFGNNIPERIHQLQDKARETRRALENKVFGMRTLARSIQSVHTSIGQGNLSDQEQAKRYDELAQSIDFWEQEYGKQDTEDKRKLWLKLEPIRQEAQQWLKSDTNRTLIRRREIEKALAECKARLEEAKASLDKLDANSEETQQMLADYTKWSDKVNEQEDQLNNRDQAMTFDEANLLMMEVISKSIFNIRELQKRVLIAESCSPEVLELERKTFAVLGDGFDIYRDRGFYIPPKENLEIQRVGMAFADRMRKLIRLGLTPDEIRAQIDHVPFSLIPDEVISEMQAFKKARQILFQKQLDAQLEENQPEKQWEDDLNRLIDESVRSAEDFDRVFQSIFSDNPEFAKALDEETLEAIKRDLQLNKDKDAKELEQNLNRAKIALKAIGTISKMLSKAVAKGEQLFAPQEETTTAPPSELPQTPGAQAAAVLKPIAKIMAGAVKILDQFRQDESRNPQQEFNEMFHRALRGTDGALMIAMGAVKIASAFTLGLDVVSGALNVARGVIKIADSIVSLAEHKSAKGKTKDLKNRAVAEGNFLQHAFQQELQNLDHQILKDSVGIVDGALRVGSGAASMSMEPIGMAVSASLKTLRRGVKLAWKAYDYSVKKETKSTVCKLFGEIVAGNRDAVGELFANSSYFAKMLIAISAHEGDDLALQYCIERGISPEDMEDEFYSKDVLHKFLLKSSGEKVKGWEEKMLMNPKVKHKTFEMPRPDGLSEWDELVLDVKEKGEEFLFFMKNLRRKGEALADKLQKKAEDLKEKLDIKIAELKIKLGKEVGQDMDFLHEHEIISAEELIEHFEDYNKIQLTESAAKGFFSAIVPRNALRSVMKEILTYTALREEGRKRLQVTIRKAAEQDSEKGLQLAIQYKDLLADLQTEARKLETVRQLYTVFELN